MNDPHEQLILKNGGEAPAAAVWAMMASLRDIAASGLPGMLALADFASYVSHNKPMPDRSRTLLVGWGLLSEDGTVHDVVRDVMLSSTKGEGLSFSLQSPVAE